MLKVPIFYACKQCWELENSLSHCILRNPSERAFNTKKTILVLTLPLPSTTTRCPRRCSPTCRSIVAQETAWKWTCRSSSRSRPILRISTSELVTSGTVTRDSNLHLLVVIHWYFGFKYRPKLTYLFRPIVTYPFNICSPLASWDIRV